MKRLLLAFLLLSAGLSSIAQQIAKYEYWFDQDEQTKITRTTTTGNIELSVDASKLNRGIHSLAFRAQDSEKRWSAPATTYFLRPEIGQSQESFSRYEYWIDTNTADKVSSTNSGGLYTFDVDASALTQGLHTVSFRATDQYGSWSAPVTSFFMVPTRTNTVGKASMYEYWLDNDLAGKVTTNLTGSIVNLDIDASKLTSGMHTFSFRCINTDGRWSAPQTSYFFVSKEKRGKQDVRAYRYWFNDASANAVVEQVSPAVIPFTLNTKLTVSDIITEVTKDNITMANDGEGRMKLATKNVLHTQYGTTDGRWGEVSSDTFAVILNEKTVDLTDFIVNTQASSSWQGWTTSGTVTGIQRTQTWTDGYSYFRLGSTSKSEWDGSMEQTIFGLPAGTYILTAKGRAATEVEAEISVNGFSESIPANGTEGGELGNGWSECSIVFTTDGQPFVLKASGSAKSTGKWMDVSDFILTYSNSANASLQVSLPETTYMQQYRNLTLSLKSVSSRLKLTTSSARSYTFQGLAEGGSYTLTLQNRSGQIVAEKTDIKIAEGENAVTLDDLKPMGSVTATVIGKDGQYLTSKALITWQTPDGEYINEGNKLSGLVSDNVVCYNVVLGDSLGTLYKEVSGGQLTVRPEENAVEIQLQPLQQNKVSGSVIWETGYGSTATVSANQKLNGRYRKTQLIKVGADGSFTLDAYCDSLHLVISADGYLDCIVDTVVTATSESLGSFALKEITGMVVEPQIAYKESRQEGDDTTTEDFFADFNNVDYQLKNIKTGTDITEYRAQNGQIIILGGAADGDEVSITLHSRKGEYADANTTVMVKSEEKATAQFEIVEYGGIKAEYTSSDNKENIIALYNASGELIRTGNYSGGQHEFLHLPDGQYSILSMGKTLSLGNIQNLADISTVGLKEGTDYLLSQAEVRAGNVRKISYDCIPSIDETLFYYTGSATSFIANKSRVVVGNYVTLTARLDFKEEYVEDVDNLSLVVALPDGCEYVPGSAIIGNAIAPCAVEDGRVIISLNKDNYQERIRFCVIPVTSGDCMPTAFASFTLDKDILQPIGSAAFTAEDLSIVVPDVTAKPEIPVSGMALPYSSVTVYDGNVVIASTSAKADGSWMVKGELVKAYDLSIHDIHAEVKTPQDICMSTESKSVQYDQNAIEVKTVTMINTAHPAGNLSLCEYRTVFDYQNPDKDIPAYWYWPSYPDFTFVVDFTNSDAVDNVSLKVHTSDGREQILKANYSEQQGNWIASGKFSSNSLPVNVSVAHAEDRVTDSETVVSTYANTLNTRSSNTSSWIVSEEHVTEDGASVRFKADDTEYNLKTSITPLSSATDNDAYTRIVVDGILLAQYLVDEEKAHVSVQIGSSLIDGLELLDDVADYCRDLKELIGSKRYLDLSMDIETSSDIEIEDAPTDPLIGAYKILKSLKTLFNGEIKIQKQRKQSEKVLRRMLRIYENGCEDGGLLEPFEESILRNETIYANVTRFASGCGAIGELTKTKYISAALDLVSKSQLFAAEMGNILNLANISNNLTSIENICNLPPYNDNDYKQSGTRNAAYVLDPSGYVYEAVSSNRLEGVTATIYQKVTTKDMYGDEHESIVKWDAEPYSQKNPVKTDFNGLYAWDVPDGLWQVKFEKEGYETVYSEWLPVPPPQLDINVPMYQSVQPEVVNAHGFESGVDFTFSKYMRPESFAEGMVTVSLGGTNVSGALQMLNIEQEPLDGIEFASHIKFVPETPFQIGEQVTLTVHKEVKSYVGVQMEKDYEVTLIIEPEIKAIDVDSVLDVSYNDSISVTIKVLSADAAKGKTLTVSNLTPSIIKTDAEEIAIEDDGTATIIIKGILPGNAALLFSIEGIDLTAMTQINVVNDNTVSSPKASIPTGSTVKKGTLLTLTCETEGATIYYTTDDSCPCDEATRLTYTEPIIINESVTIKAMAVAPNMADSEIAVITINLLGDVNGDQILSFSDVEGIVCLALNIENKGLNAAAADINQDGIVSISDAVLLINLLTQRLSK